ncbi:MAG TPA: hypothetical protein ENI94_02465 [Gammaproteobacteria bacterium]|nr:hypothetical protein [Gammaproteobacteria bacterium]
MINDRRCSGLLAKQAGKTLPLTVLKSPAGYYIGTSLDGVPYSRESVEYFSSSSQAEDAFQRDNWTQRICP